MEQQLAKLVEQALWAMGSDPTYAVPSVTSSLEDCLSSDLVKFESWMMSTGSGKGKPGGQTGDAKKKKKPKKTVRSSTAPVIGDLIDDGGSETTKDTILEEDQQDGDMSPTIAPCSLQGGERAMSDDESVGMGSFHLGEAGTLAEVSCDPTAASTPNFAHTGKKSGCLPTPPPSPLAAHQAMAPNRLVCYIWNQASQCEHNLLSPRSTAGSALGQSTADTPTPKVASTPFTRGQWTGPPGRPVQHAQPSMISVVVRNTFVDIDDPSQCPLETLRKSRSLSPTRSGD